MQASPEEKFALGWRGKAAAFESAKKISRAKLRRVSRKENTRNALIIGDNLEALKLLHKNYAGKVKLVLIDPPYNTGAPLLYADRFGSSTDRHSEWLSMMAPRLLLAREMLSEEGVIFVHIDEYQQATLDLLLCEIFGDENRIGTIIWDKRNPKGDSHALAEVHEYIIGFARNLSAFTAKNDLHRPKPNAQAMVDAAARLWAQDAASAPAAYRSWLAAQSFGAGEKAYRYLDEKGEIYRKVSMAWPNRKPAPPEFFLPLIHPVTQKPCPVPAKGWRNAPETMARLMAEGNILFGPDESLQPTRKYLLRENMSEKLASVIHHGGSDDALLAQMGLVFDNPKPLAVLRQIIAATCKGEEIVMDFFAGSGSTAHAVLDHNAQSGDNLAFIAVQRPEPLARKSGDFETIADLCRARITRAGERLRKAPHHSLWRGDAGFVEYQIAAPSTRATKSGNSSK